MKGLGPKKINQWIQQRESGKIFFEKKSNTVNANESFTRNRLLKEANNTSSEMYYQENIVVKHSPKLEAKDQIQGSGLLKALLQDLSVVVFANIRKQVRRH